jgi:hypothetical protein
LPVHIGHAHIVEIDHREPADAAACERLDRQVPSRVSRPHRPTVALCCQQ